MDNTREKLIELLTDDYCPIIYMQGEVGGLADYLINRGVTVQQWIPVTERLPEEHDSIWAKLYGTKSWQPGLFRKRSDTVIACVERKDGKRRSVAIYTIDGKWDRHKLRDETVTHWMPLPEMPKEE